MNKNVMERMEKYMNLAWLFYSVQFLLTVAGLMYYFGFNQGLFGEETILPAEYFLGIVLVMVIINGYFLVSDRRLYRRMMIRSDSREVPLRTSRS